MTAARSNPALRASANHGKPPIAATSKPGQFSGAGVVAAKVGGGLSVGLGFSARYDRFVVDSIGAEGYGAQSGHAWTAAYVFTPETHWRFTLEWIQVVSSNYSREELGGAPILTERQLQLAVRYALGSSVY